MFWLTAEYFIHNQPIEIFNENFMDLDDFGNSYPWIRKEIHDRKETEPSYFRRNSKMPRIYADYYKERRERHISIMKSYLLPIWSLPFFD